MSDAEKMLALMLAAVALGVVVLVVLALAAVAVVGIVASPIILLVRGRIERSRRVDAWKYPSLT